MSELETNVLLENAMRAAFAVRHERDLLTVVELFHTALKDLTTLVAESPLTKEQARRYVSHHPVTCLFACRIGELTETGGVELVASGTTGLSDVYSDAIGYLEERLD